MLLEEIGQCIANGTTKSTSIREGYYHSQREEEGNAPSVWWVGRVWVRASPYCSA